MGNKLLTITELGRRLGLPPYVVNYAIIKFRLEPATRIGIARVWSENDLPKIREAVEKTATTKRDGCSTPAARRGGRRRRPAEAVGS